MDRSHRKRGCFLIRKKAKRYDFKAPINEGEKSNAQMKPTIVKQQPLQLESSSSSLAQNHANSKHTFVKYGSTSQVL